MAAPVFRSRESEADVSGDVAVARTAPGVTPTVWAETGILGWTFVGREPAALEQLKTLRSTVDDADQRSASSIDEQRDINIHIGTSVREAIVEFSADFVSPPVGIPNETPGSTPAIARRSRLPSHHPGRNRIYRNDMRGRKPSLAHLLLAAAHVAARRSVDRQVRLLRFRLLTICGVSVKYAAR